VAFGPLNLGQSPGDARETALATLDRLGLAGFGNRLTHRLSGGEKKLVSLATVLAMEPAALLLDEPTAGLDQDTVARLGGILAGLGLAMVVISHDFDFLEDLSDEIMAMKDGRVLTGAAVPHRHVHVHDHGDLPHDHGADQAPDKG
jgi:cobalt/nickel transport system ATP-binding protein